MDIPNSVLDQHPVSDPENTMPALDCALNLAADGWAVFPMSRHKTPLKGSRGVRDASRDPDRLREMFGRPGAELAAIATGTPSGISVLDVDRQHGGLDWLRENLKRLPETLAWRTRSGGVHLIFWDRPELRTVALGTIGRGIEIRATGASAIFWPATGREYLAAGQIARWPDWLLPPPRPTYSPPPPAAWCGTDRRARAYAEGALRRAIERVASAGLGERNATLNTQAFALSRFVSDGSLSAGEIAYALASAATAAGLEGRETVATLRSALRAGGAA